MPSLFMVLGITLFRNDAAGSKSTSIVPLAFPLIAGAGTVSWNLKAVAVSDDDPIDVAYGTFQESEDTFILAEDEHIGPESAAITIAGTPAQGERAGGPQVRATLTWCAR